MHIVIRTWNDAASLADAMEQRAGEVRELISGVPGFVAYYATRSGDMLTTVTVCEDRAGTQESTRVAGDWVRQNVSRSPGAPVIVEGEVFLHV